MPAGDGNNNEVNGNSVKINSKSGAHGGDENFSLAGSKHWIAYTLFLIFIFSTCVYFDARLPNALTSQVAGPRRFSEERARRHMDALTKFGPRVSGSRANEILAKNYLIFELENIRKHMDKKIFRLELDVQHPKSSCFGLDFLSSSTLCYKKITNVVARFGRSGRPSEHSLLINCHFDSVFQSVGATDDAISCAIMIELLNVFSQYNGSEILPYDVIFLFNGAEENMLHGSHGFITQHPWRRNIRAFINLEGAGAGGREFLFQAGPKNSWLLKSYLDNAPHPYCSILGQEIFESGLLPGDTDFRIFRDYGHLAGMDFAYVSNGYLYHTEFDRPEYVRPGSLQHTGENLLATVPKILSSSCFSTRCHGKEPKIVFFDVLGLFVLQHKSMHTIGYIYILAAVMVRIWYQFNTYDETAADETTPANDGYSKYEFFISFCLQVISAIFIVGVGLFMVYIISVLSLQMAWYGRPFLAFVFYVAPMTIAGLSFHALTKGYLLNREGIPTKPGNEFRLEQAMYDSTILLFSILLTVMTSYKLASSIYVLMHVVFPFGRHVMLSVWNVKKNRATAVLLCQCMALLPTMIVDAYIIRTAYNFFIPIFGRSGPTFNPEYAIFALSLICAVVIVFFMAGIVYISGCFCKILIFALGVTLLTIAVAASSTDFGSPYVYDLKAPRVRRLHIQHVSRKVHGVDGRVLSHENGLLYASLDYRGALDLPEEFLKNSSSPRCLWEDDYCGLPYFYPAYQLLPPNATMWMPVPSSPVLSTPLQVKRIWRRKLSKKSVKMRFVVSGPDHMTLFITPLRGCKLKSWTFTRQISAKRTQFVSLASVGDKKTWQFSLTLQGCQFAEKKKDAILLLGVASHFVHGNGQYSDLTRNMLSEIRSRRNQSKAGYKWRMTADAYNSEYSAFYLS